ncbi:MAG: hypothetical protein H6592_10650 [Flavobacteriales bacterium]|nr:hypothetical protein [Flavobacteriales bacterium]
MDLVKLKAHIASRLADEVDRAKLESILRMLEQHPSAWPADHELVVHVLAAEEEYTRGEAIPIDVAREVLKRSRR